MEFVPAPFWRRFVARTLDLLICIPLTFVAAIPVAIVMLPLLLVMSTDSYSSLGAFMSFVVAFTLVEYFLLRRRSGQTLGKGLLGLRVLEADDLTGKGAVSAKTALVRLAVLTGPLMAALAVFYLTYDEVTETSDNPVSTGLLYLWMAVLAGSALSATIDRRLRRGLHDMAAGTRVVRAHQRNIDLREDLMMLVPGKVNLEKRPAPTPITLTKTV